MTDAWGAEYTSFACRHCGTHTRGQVLGSHYFQDNLDGHGGPTYRYRLVECSNCHDASLLISMEIGPSVFEDEVALYPAPPKYLSGAVPESLRLCLEEARTCLSAKAYTASVMMYRRALELLAADRGLKKASLNASLTALRDQKVIDERLFLWADALRLAGNEAAHDVHLGISPSDARDTSDLAEAIIDYVYVFQERYDAFKKRRAARERTDS